MTPLDPGYVRKPTPMPEAKWLNFQEARVKEGYKTRVFIVLAKQDGILLGRIAWFGRWRKYVFYPESGGCIFETDCLRDIAAFLDWLMEDRRERRAAEAAA